MSLARTCNQQAKRLRLAPAGCLHPASASCSAQRGRRRLEEAQAGAAAESLHGCWAPRYQPSCPDCSSRTAEPWACHCVSAWPSFIYKPRVIWPSTSCLLLTPHFNSTGEKNGPRSRLLYSPARWHKPGCTSASVCSHLPAQPRSPISQATSEEPTFCKTVTTDLPLTAKRGASVGFLGEGGSKARCAQSWQEKQLANEREAASSLERPGSTLQGMAGAQQEGERQRHQQLANSRPGATGKRRNAHRDIPEMPFLFCSPRKTEAPAAGKSEAGSDRETEKYTPRHPRNASSLLQP